LSGNDGGTRRAAEHQGRPADGSFGGRAPQDANRLAYFILKSVNRAIREFDLLRSGDRVAVALSGGKDSVGLLSLLARHRRSSAITYELAAVHVLGDAGGVIALHRPLVEWLAGQGLPFLIVEPDLGIGDAIPLDCQRCTWLRRKALFLAAERLDCNVIAFAHHADDAAQTTLLNLLYGGQARTLSPVSEYFSGRFRLIRPLFYVPECDLASYARASGFPPPPPPCSRAGTGGRSRVTEMLKLLGRDYLIQARMNLIRAGLAGESTIRETQGME